MSRVSGVLSVAAAVALGACGGGAGEGGGGCTPSGLTTMTLAATGVTPKAVCVLPLGTVTFVNNDTVPHTIEGDGACTALNLTIPNGESRGATVPNVTQICTFHEAGSPGNAAFQGTVAVTLAPAVGPGY